MISSPPKKRGRPQARHRCRDGTEIQGLTRLGDGRWKVSATGATFVEPNEDTAVARFLAISEKLRQKNRVSLPLPSQPNAAAAIEAAKAAGGARVSMTLTRGQSRFKTSIDIDSEPFWTEVRRLLLEEPDVVARRTGVEWVRRGAELSPPKPSPNLTALGDLYFAKTGLSPNELSRSKLFWKEFKKGVGVDTTREITHDVVAEYERRIKNRDLSPKSILHRYNKIRGVFHHAIKRGQSPDDCRKALDVLAMLEVKGTKTLDPTPITPEQFWAIYDEARAADDGTFAALLLMALNSAMYGGEVANLKWAEIDLDAGELVTRRPKTKISRVAMLWPQTVATLKALPQLGDAIFYTRVRSFTVFSVGDRFERYRDAANVKKELTFGSIRDASYTVACRASLDQARMLAGHRAGIADHYLRRKPDLVADACAAIAKAFGVDEHCSRTKITGKKRGPLANRLSSRIAGP